MPPAVVDQSTLFAARVFVGLIPVALPKAMFVSLDFTAATGSDGADIEIDLEVQEEQYRLEFVQSVFVDNTLSKQDFTLKALSSQHWLTIASGKQAMLPILAPPSCKFTGSIAAAASGVVKVQFANFYVPPIVW